MRQIFEACEEQSLLWLKWWTTTEKPPNAGKRLTIVTSERYVRALGSHIRNHTGVVVWSSNNDERPSILKKYQSLKGSGEVLPNVGSQKHGLAE
jgi:hypothetical protein